MKTEIYTYVLLGAVSLVAILVVWGFMGAPRKRRKPSQEDRLVYQLAAFQLQMLIDSDDDQVFFSTDQMPTKKGPSEFKAIEKLKRLGIAKTFEEDGTIWLELISREKAEAFLRDAPIQIPD